jgi:hypothetical protein
MRAAIAFVLPPAPMLARESARRFELHAQEFIALSNGEMSFRVLGSAGKTVSHTVYM